MRGAIGLKERGRCFMLVWTVYFDNVYTYVELRLSYGIVTYSIGIPCHPSEVGKMSTSQLVRGAVHQWQSCVPNQ